MPQTVYQHAVLVQIIQVVRRPSVLQIRGCGTDGHAVAAQVFGDGGIGVQGADANGNVYVFLQHIHAAIAQIQHDFHCRMQSLEGSADGSDGLCTKRRWGADGECACWCGL